MVHCALFIIIHRVGQQDIHHHISSTVSTHFGLERFSENTPKQWEAIVLYLEHVNHDSVADMHILCVDTDEATDTSSGSRKKTKVAFIGSPQDFKPLAAALTAHHRMLVASLKKLYRPLFASPDKKCPLKPLVLTPPVRHCCGHNLHIRNRLAPH